MRVLKWRTASLMEAVIIIRRINKIEKRNSQVRVLTPKLNSSPGYVEFEFEFLCFFIPTYVSGT